LLEKNALQENLHAGEKHITRKFAQEFSKKISTNFFLWKSIYSGINKIVIRRLYRTKMEDVLHTDLHALPDISRVSAEAVRECSNKIRN